MSVVLSTETAKTAPSLNRGWLLEVSGLTGSVLARPLLQTAGRFSDQAVASCRQNFLAWLLVGDDGESGAQVAEEALLLRRLFPMTANLTRLQTSVTGTLSPYLTVIENTLTTKQYEANQKREALIRSSKGIEEGHRDLIAMCRDYASVCALEVVEGVISSQISWEQGNFKGSGHMLAEAILAYTSTEAFWAAVRFWTGESVDSQFVRLYGEAYQAYLAADGLDQQSLARMFDSHNEALDEVRTAARLYAAVKMESLLKE